MTKQRKITATGLKSGIPMNLGNYMDGNAAEFRRVVNEQPMNATAICDALNDHPWTYDKFRPFSQSDGCITIVVTDGFGNKDLIKIAEQ